MLAENALERAVREVERHESAAGWNRPPSLYALAGRDDLVRDEPDLARQLGLGSDSGELTPVAQESLEIRDSLPAALASIDWPPDVVGAVLSLETVVLPGDVEERAPDAEAGSWALEQPTRVEGRVVVGVLRDGRRAAALRWRNHDRDEDVLTGPDLAPALADALAASMAPSG